MQLHHVKPTHQLKKRKRIARGGKRGGYSGRGIKGQKSRAGAGIRPAIRDLMMKLPKMRGRAKHSFKSLFSKPVVLNLRDIEKKFKTGEIVSPQILLERRMIQKKGDKLPEVKILGDGKILRKLVFRDVLLSKSARDKIEKAKGFVQKSE